MLKKLKFGSESRAFDSSICVPGSSGGTVRLVPVGPWVENSSFPSLVSDWRNNAMGNFFSQFLATPENALSYLNAKAIGRDDCILFAIAVDDRFVGHIGLANFDGNQLELDNVVRGEPTQDKKLMNRVLSELTSWCVSTLLVESIFLRVMSTNTRAIQLYESCGFKIEKSIPMKEIKISGFPNYVEADLESSNTEVMCVYMRLEI